MLPEPIDFARFDFFQTKSNKVSKFERNLFLDEPLFLDFKSAESWTDDQEFGDGVFETTRSVETLLLHGNVLPDFELMDQLEIVKNLNYKCQN